MRRTIARALTVGLLVVAGSGFAVGAADAKPRDCAALNRGFDWALANLLVADGYLTEAIYRGALDYYSGELDAAGC
jgi:hypothetical protein